MQLPWRLFALSMWAVACPLEAQESAPSMPVPRELLYFDRNATDLSPKGREKLAALIREWGKGGVWVIGVPRNSQASETVTQGRVRTLVGLLMEQGVLDVRTQPVPAVPRETYEPLVVGKAGPASVPEPEAEPMDIDPNEDEPTPRPKPQTKQMVPPPPPVVPDAPPVAQPLARPTGWVALSAHVAYQSLSAATPPTARLEASPFPMVGVGAVAVPGALRLEAGYAKSARNAFGVKEQGEPSRNLDVSDASTTFSERVSFSLGLTQGWPPLRFFYVDEKQSQTAVLTKGTLILDRSGEGWVSLVDDVRFAYRTRVKGLGLDWRFGDEERDAWTWWLGLYSDQVEKPFSLNESGAFENHALYTATYTAAGLRVRLQSDPFREGLAFGDLALQAGRAKRLEVQDKYHLLLAEVGNRGFNEASLRMAPRYLAPFGKRGFFRISLPLAYTLNTARSQSTAGPGYAQLTGLYGNRFEAALKLEVGFRN